MPGCRRGLGGVRGWDAAAHLDRQRAGLEPLEASVVGVARSAVEGESAVAVCDRAVELGATGVLEVADAPVGIADKHVALPLPVKVPGAGRSSAGGMCVSRLPPPLAQAKKKVPAMDQQLLGQLLGGTVRIHQRVRLTLASIARAHARRLGACDKSAGKTVLQVGGALQAVVGHPLDTIKVRLQSQSASDPSRYKV